MATLNDTPSQFNSYSSHSSKYSLHKPSWETFSTSSDQEKTTQQHLVHEIIVVYYTCTGCPKSFKFGPKTCNIILGHQEDTLKGLGITPFQKSLTAPLESDTYQEKGGCDILKRTTWTVNNPPHLPGVSLRDNQHVAHKAPSLACSARSTKTSISSTRILSDWGPLGIGVRKNLMANGCTTFIRIARLLKEDHDGQHSTPVGLMIKCVLVGIYLRIFK